MKNNIYLLIKIASIITFIIPNAILDVFWGLINPFNGYLAIFTRNVLICRRVKKYNAYIYIGSNVTLKNIENAYFGKNISIHNNSYIDAAGGLEIFDNVSIAHNSSIVTFEHSWNERSLPIKYNPTYYDRVVINEDVWIGCGVRILSGSKIGSRVVVGAGSIVRGELLSNSIYVGNPVKKVKEI